MNYLTNDSQTEPVATPLSPSDEEIMAVLGQAVASQEMLCARLRDLFARSQRS